MGRYRNGGGAMAIKGKEVIEEMSLILSGKSFDAVFPSLVFVLINGFYGLNTAIFSSVGVALLFCIIRLLSKQPFYYATGGLLGGLIASGFAYFAGNASNYFIPKIISSAFVFLLSFTSLLMGKPLAAWASHLTRGWDLKWYWRKDVKPAYREVTWIWTIFFLIRLVLQISLFLSGNIIGLIWLNTLLGFPVSIIGLVPSYIYGSWRLHKLKGPSVEEYLEGIEAPWKGQTRGF